MKPKPWFRIGALLLILFALGHTIGFLTFRAPSPESRAVWEGMNNTRFSDGHGSYTYGDFYRGFGLFISAYLVFTAFVAWTLGRAEVSQLRTNIAWALVIVQLVCVALALRYFGAVQAIVSSLTVIPLLIGALSLRTAPRAGG